MAHENVIEMRDITKVFGEFVANDKINLHLRKGEIHALLGENGAGKSTLMNMLAGLLEPTSGEIAVNGQVVNLGNMYTDIDGGDTFDTIKYVTPPQESREDVDQTSSCKS